MFKIMRLLLIAMWLVLCFALFRFLGWLAVLVLIGLAYKYGRKPKPLSAHGTARFATEDDLDLDADGLCIGKLEVPSHSLLAVFNPKMKSRDACLAAMGKRPWPLVRLPNVIHSAIFIPTGGGKGSCFGIPHAMTCRDSAVYLDLNAEIASATIEARLKMGHRVVLLDPHHVYTNQSDGLNVLDFIPANSPTALDQVRSLAESLVIRTGQEKEPHWPEVAEDNICTTMAHVVNNAPPDDRSLLTVAGILADPEERAAVIPVMRQSTAFGGIMARMGARMTHYKEKELASVMTTVGRYLRFLDSPDIAACVSRSTFDPADLLTGKLTVFIITKPEFLRVDIPWIRVCLSALLMAVVKGGVNRDRRVHYLLDEAGSIGAMQCLEDALDKYRKFGVRVTWMYQAAGQLPACWPNGKDQVLVANTTTIFAGVNDLPTAQMVSERLGDETRVVTSGGTSRGWSHQASNHSSQQSSSYSVNSSDNWNQVQRRLLKPEEILTMDPHTAITFHPGLPPIRTQLVPYYQNAEPRRSWLADVWMLMQCLAMLLGALLVLGGAMGINIHHWFARTP
jgi:type IV secretion system protein VirD4